MNPLLSSAILLTVIYLSECVAWARHGTLMLHAPLYWMGGFIGKLLPRSMSTPSSMIGSAAGGLFFLLPVPPFGRPHLLSPPMFMADAQWLVGWSSASFDRSPRNNDAPKKLAWADIKHIDFEGKSVLIDGKGFCSCATPAHARLLMKQLRELHRAPPTERANVAQRQLDDSLDAERLRSMLMRSEEAMMPMLLTQVVLFVLVFGAVPWRIHKQGLDAWQPMLVAVYGVMLLATMLFAVVHHALLPLERGERWLHVFLSVLLPTQTLRNIDKVSKPLLAGFHPALVAAELLRGDHRAFVVGAMLRDLAHPRAHSDDADVQAMDTAQRASVLQALQARIPAVVLEGLPKPRVSEAFPLHCPRCLEVYRAQNAGACTDCSQVKLVG
jgi:hypothetical protein